MTEKRELYWNISVIICTIFYWIIKKILKFNLGWNNFCFPQQKCLENPRYLLINVKWFDINTTTSWFGSIFLLNKVKTDFFPNKLSHFLGPHFEQSEFDSEQQKNTCFLPQNQNI